MLLLAPFAPHIAEELWQRMGHDQSLAYAAWPVAQEAFLRSDTFQVAVQVNGKTRGLVTVPADASTEQALAIAEDDENVARHLRGKRVRRSIYVRGRIVNFVVWTGRGARAANIGEITEQQHQSGADDHRVVSPAHVGGFVPLKPRTVPLSTWGSNDGDRAATRPRGSMMAVIPVFVARSR